MDAVSAAIIAVLVFAVAFVYANLGLGGGLLYVPILLSPLWTDDTAVAVPISLSLVVATGVASTWNHSRAGYVEPRIVGLMVPAAVLGVVVGVAFTLNAPKEIFLAAFIAVILVVGVKMLWDWARHPSTGDADDPAKLTPARKAASGSAAAASGFLSGGLGIGGGLANVPILVYGLGRSARRAIGTSSAIIVPTAIVGFAAYVAAQTLDSTDYVLIVVLWPLVFVGAFVGSRLGLARLRTRSVALAFILVLFIAAGKLIYDLIAAL